MVINRYLKYRNYKYFSWSEETSIINYLIAEMKKENVLLYYCDDKFVGVCILNGCTIRKFISFAPNGGERFLVELLNYGQIKQFAKLKLRVSDENEKMCKLVSKVGFEKIFTIADKVYYEINL